MLKRLLQNQDFFEMSGVVTYVHDISFVKGFFPGQNGLHPVTHGFPVYS